MRISIVHRIVCRYAGEIVHSAQYLRLTPGSNPSQQVRSWHIGAPDQLTPWRDAFGNRCHTLVVERPGHEIVIVASGQVDTTNIGGVLPNDDGALPIEVFLRPTELTHIDAAVRDYAHSFDRPLSHSRLEGLHALMGGIRERIGDGGGAGDVISTASEVLQASVGVCQDHAHLFIACCRALGVPARYVGGYLFDGERDDANTSGHGWAAAWVDDLGWVSFDVTNMVCGTDRHVGVSIGLDCAGAAPVRGVRSGVPGAEELEVAVRVSANQ